jgi:hypothetical protein
MSVEHYADIACNSCGEFFDFCGVPTSNTRTIRAEAKDEGWLYTKTFGGRDWCTDHDCQKPIIDERKAKKRATDIASNAKRRGINRPRFSPITGYKPARESLAPPSIGPALDQSASG